MKTKHRILSVLTILALVASLTAVMAAPVGALEERVFAVHPTSGPSGTEVRVLGSGFPRNVVAELTAYPAGVIHRQVFMISPDETIDLTVTIRADADVGLAAFRVHVGDVLKATAPFTVTVLPPRITLSPPSGVAGTEVTVIGVRFPANDWGIIEDYAAADGVVIHPVTFLTDADGRIPATVVTILALQEDEPLSQDIVARVGGLYDRATFTVIPVPDPYIELDPTDGVRGTSVRVTGNHFPHDAHGIITAPGVIHPVTFVTNDATGRLGHRVGGVFKPWVDITIRTDAPFGLATITAEVGVASAIAHFIVEHPDAPRISLYVDGVLRTDGARGTEVYVTGANFPLNTAGVIMGPGLIAPIGFRTDAAGRIRYVDPRLAPADRVRVSVDIRADAPFGAGTITATVGVKHDDAPFTVRAPLVTLSPIGGVVGARVYVTGRGFPPGEDGTITAPGVISPTRFPATDARGRFSASAIILVGAPLGPATFTVTVDDADRPDVIATATYTVGITPTIALDPTIGFEGTRMYITGYGFPVNTSGAATAPDVIGRRTFRTDPAGRIRYVDPRVAGGDRVVAPIVTGAPVGAATITVTVGDVTATAVFAVAGPGVPVIVPEPVVPVLEGLEVVWEELGESVWHFMEGNWYQFHTDQVKHALIPAARRLDELKTGEAYWIYLTEDITDVLIGGVLRTLPAGWHNIGWVL